MTLNGAIMQLVELSEHPMMHAIFRPAIQKVIETISELEENPEPHWIPVTERLPEESGLYLVTERGMFSEAVYTRYWNYDRSGRNAHWSGYGNSADVTAWCELPEPYKGVTE